MELDESFQSQFSSDPNQNQPFSLDNHDTQNDKFIGQKSIKNIPLSPEAKQYFQKYKKTNIKAFLKLFHFQDQVPQHKSVCAKPINKGDTIAECYDCATDSSCIQCLECFKNSNHEGHKVIIKTAYGGCCDCGDAEAWKKEGFCSKHTGESIDVEIDPKEEENFTTQMKQLFFLIFWQSIRENTNNCKEYSQKLLQSLCYLNKKGVYYNKLTCLVFGSQIPQDLVVSKNVNNRTILGNLLSPKVAKHLNIDEWMDLFFSMFQYYPFKKLLLSTYIKNFSIIYCDEESEMRGSTISCQLLTSYQLVRQYALEKGSVPLGSDIQIDKLTSYERPFYMMYHDLEYLTKLAGDTPEIYFRFHMRNEQGIYRLFQYTKVIDVLQLKQRDEPDILQLARFVKNFQLEFRAMQIVSRVAGILQKDKDTLKFIIKFLFKEALKENNPKRMIIFKPLTRALTVFMFAYFDLDLRNMDCDKLENKEKVNDLLEFIKVEGQDMKECLNKLFKVCMETFLFHSKILAESGLNSTLYVYLYYYKMKNRFIGSVDILSVKMLAILLNQAVICPSDYLWQIKTAFTVQAKKQQLQTKIQNLKFMLLQLNLVTASESNELYVALDINPTCTIYQNYVDTLLPKIMHQEKATATLALTKEYQDTFFHKNCDLAHNHLKKFCNFDKNKKAFVIAHQIPQTETDTLNYVDFRCNLTNKNQFQSPQKTINLIKSSETLKIFDQFWSVETIKRFVVKVIEFLQTYKSFSSQNNHETFVEKFHPLFIQLMKIIYIKRKISKTPQDLDIVLEFLRKIQGISKLIDPFYETLIHPNKMEEEKGNQMEEEREESPKKPNLEAKNSEDLRKKVLKQKMEQKKKMIKQRYAKQLAQFEKEEKNKLEKQQEKDQTEHKLNCIICKSEDPMDLVYLTHIGFRNHQKLLGMGEGVSCLSIQSCYHPVDFGCYSKLASEVGNKKKPIIRCPFCKFKSNTFFPVISHSKHSIQAIRKFEMAIFLEKNVDEISVVEEVIKSFYHFSLLAHLDPQRTLNRRLKIYRIILEILQANSKVYLVSDVYKKFITQKMNLNPKVLDENEYQINRHEKIMQLTMLLENSGNQITLEDLNEDQIEQLVNLLGEGENNQPQNAQNPGVFGSFVNKLKEKLSSVKKTSSETQIKNQTRKYTPIFKETLRRLFLFLGFKDTQIEEEKQERMEEESQQPKTLSLIEQELSPELEVCLKKLFEEKSTQNKHQHVNNIYESLNENNNSLKFRDLPMNFKPLGKLNRCNFCEQISPSVTICLLCDWQGCLKNCLRVNGDKSLSKLGGAVNHSQVHGEESLFLNMSKCYVAKINSEGWSETMGCIYKDEWGNDFSIKGNWESFFLDEGELSKFKLAFLHDQ